MCKILRQLKTECPFATVFEDVDENTPGYAPVYRQKIGHLRADHDGWRWWSTWWSGHDELLSDARKAEIDSVYESLTAKDALADLPTLIRFCQENPAASVHPNGVDGEYNFYYEGTRCNYWVRLICRLKDYNLYLHAFAREEAL